MKHLIKVCCYVFFPSGGIGRYTNELLRALSTSLDVSLEAVCSPDFAWKDAPEYPAWTGLRSISHPVPTLRRLRFLYGQFGNPLRCIKHAIETDTHIIHFSNINHLSFPYWKKRLKTSGVRMAISVHDVKRQKSIVNRQWEDRQLKAIYHFADALFVHSAYQMNELVEYAGVCEDKIHIVPHGPYQHGPASADRDEIRAKLGLPADAQIALCFGQIRDEKNLDQLIEAIPLSAAALHLVVAGREVGRHRGIDAYRSLAKRMGVDRRITFIPRFISEVEVGELFTAVDWVAIPYRNTFTSQSGVLNVAAHYERPVLVSSAPVLQETVEACDVGVVCAGDTAIDIAAGIDRIAQRIRDGYRHRFQEYRRLFSWQENARRTLEVYRSLAA